jgi:hypothetical protein
VLAPSDGVSGYLLWQHTLFHRELENVFRLHSRSICDGEVISESTQVSQSEPFGDVQLNR